MSYNKIFSKIIIISIICITINSKLVYAIDENSIDNSIQNIEDEQYIAKVTETELASIEKLLEYINKEVKSIDDKIALSRTMPEYEKYPAVRLNIDTPYFGMFSIINSKLKIRNKVSTVDIASGYSIRNIINKRTIKIETFEVSNIVVITRDLKIDKEMTSSDAKTCILKLVEYLDQAKSVNKFLDKQLTVMIKGYLLKDKNDKIYDIDQQTKEIEENLSFSAQELSYINALTDSDITEDINTLYKYKDEIISTESKLKSILISKEKLDEIFNNLLKSNAEIKLFRFNVNKKYLELSSDIDLEKAINLIILKMNNELLYIQDYIDKSKIEIVSQLEDNTIEAENVAENSDSEINTASVKNIKEKQYENIYKIASETIFQNMKKDIDRVNVILNKVVQNNMVNEEQTENVEKLDEKKLAEELLKIYIEFLNKQNVFLTENVKINITDIKQFNDININSFEDIEYIYINISDILTRISNNFESNSVISNLKTSEGFKQVIGKVILSGSNLKKKIVTDLQ